MDTFKQDLKDFSKGVAELGNSLMRGITIAAYQGVVVETRVDNGTARLNWHVSMAGPLAPGKADPQPKPAKGAPANGNEWAKSDVGGVTLKLKAGAIGAVWISNALPYISKLNDEDHMIENVMAEIGKKFKA